VYRLTGDTALIQTLDFFTPIVDDPELFGQIAVTNALSDVYAMGGRPVCAMNIVCFPIKQLDVSVLRSILKGGLDKMAEAGVALAGGHSVENDQLMYGLSVTGLVHPDRIWTNQGAQSGDALVLTKPLGTGLITTAIKAGLAEETSIASAIASMASLNRLAAEHMKDLPVHACTDVTGFGLIGHAAEMIDSASVGLEIQAGLLPLFPGIEVISSMGLLPAGLHRNRKYRESRLCVESSIPQHLLDAVWDPQTSGGLLAALPEQDAIRLVSGLHAEGLTSAAIIGRVIDGSPGTIFLVP
jgi:selenide,water dikinase